MGNAPAGLSHDNPAQPPSFVPEVSWAAIQSSVLDHGDRRLEAETYLSDGYGLRSAIEARPRGWAPLGDLADVWQPSRLKGVVVDPQHGTPFLAAGQVFELRPMPRKWLSLSRTPDARERFVNAGTILVSCSGNVGRVTIAHAPHLGSLISHDLMRVDPGNSDLRGWLYAYMRTSVFRLMATGVRYGHIIKHLEVSHLNAIPVIGVSDADADEFLGAVEEIFASRDRAHELVAAAESLYASALQVDLSGVDLDHPYTASSAELTAGRRRLDGYYHNPIAASILRQAEQRADEMVPIAELCDRIFYPSRFRRAYGDNGIPYRSAEELFDLNPPVTKRIYASLVEDREDYILHAGWIVMACSGQIYGLNGAVTLLDSRQEGIFASHDLIRLVPDPRRVRSGYLLTALGHPALGRPVVVRNAYGTSIPHLDVSDVQKITVPRLDPAVERDIADRMEKAARLRSKADGLEDEITSRAEELVTKFIREKNSPR